MLLTVLTAAASGLFLLRCRVPGGMLVGAILGVAILNLATEHAFLYPQTRVAAQALTGAYIGCMMTREDISRLPRLLPAYLVMMGSFLALNLSIAAFMLWATDYDLLACLFCTAPGGVSDTPLIAMDMGADGSVVAVMQFVRMLFGLTCLPTIILLSDRLLEPETAQAMEARARELNQNKGTKKKARPSLVGFLPTSCAALAAAVLGRISGIPAGALSAALVVSAAMKLTGHCPGMPMWLRRVAQVISGCCIGSSITRAQVLQMGQLALPVVVLCLGYIVCCIGIGLLVSRLFRVQLREAMLTMSPAGASEMALIAADFGLENSTNLVVLQICRLVGVLVIFPQIFQVIVLILG